jgi:hypothetical protein
MPLFLPPRLSVLTKLTFYQKPEPQGERLLVIWCLRDGFLPSHIFFDSFCHNHFVPAAICGDLTQTASKVYLQKVTDHSPNDQLAKCNVKIKERSDVPSEHQTNNK